MDYSTFGFEFDCDAEGVVIEVESLYARLESLTDKRDPRGRRYPLPLVLVAVILAKLAGETKPEGIAAWAQLRVELFRPAFGLKQARMPHANTFRRLLTTVIRLEELVEIVEGFLKDLLGAAALRQYGVDGKTLRGARREGARTGPQLLAVYVPGSGITLRQLPIAESTTEIPVAQQALKSLDLRGKIVTGDALHTQRKTSEVILDGGGDYVWLVKDNQERLRQDIQLVFEPESCPPGHSPAPTDFRTVQQVNKGHGRIETRTLTVSSLLADTPVWPGVAQVFKLRQTATTLQGEQLWDEVVFGLTSLTATQASPADLLRLRRQHWAIESELHYRRDVTLGEDACHCKHPRFAQALATLNNLVIALLLRNYSTNAAQSQRYYDAHPDRALNLLFRAPVRL
jgi:predicted transposase YbfD/YdcC